MVNQTVLAYLRQYKDNYKLDDLKKEIISKGYTETDFSDALREMNSQRFKAGEVSRLPTTNVMDESKKHMSLWKLLLVIFLILLFGVGAFILLNYLDISLFGINLFDYF